MTSNRTTRRSQCSVVPIPATPRIAAAISTSIRLCVGACLLGVAANAQQTTLPPEEPLLDEVRAADRTDDLPSAETFAAIGGADSGSSSDSCGNIDKSKQRDDCYVAVAMCGPGGVKELSSNHGVTSVSEEGLIASSTLMVVCKDSGGSDD